MKINIDAAVFLDGSIGVGAVIRDSQAKFVGAEKLQGLGDQERLKLWL